ncbi:SDR family oxidoreductase [Nocardioides carbamazepini]|uniref:SDR family NAD(P)-dependent oxidoreductase n=1 Tax=Nocardioides carbamazepini TaxID=2854259 RepID=UPI00214A38F4|nr:SDR family NAD(P)-dependent oxidoreductase [Nocardioides carbamazepini]MCR1781290.1 SDR family oxidoreductase [Nocardioides carbamazepini]
MSMSFDFTGQTVVVTGAAQGIGLEMARFFVDAGATTYLIDFEDEALATAAVDTGGRGVRADVSSTGDVEAVIRQVIEETGRVDVLVNNAGILRDTVVWKLADEDWDAVLNVHAGGTFRFTRACVPHFRTRGYGRIINVTSYTGLHGNVGQANYATAKAGIIGFTKTTAKELARFGVTVNAISPNARTRMIDSIPADRAAELAATIPMGRFSEPAEVCSTVGFLAATESGYVTGVVLPVDGGISI